MNIFDRIRAIGLPDGQFVVMGSAILEVKGIRTAHDLDIMVTPELFEELKQGNEWTYTHKVGALGDAIELLEKDQVQLYQSVYGKEDFNYFFTDPRHLELIDGIYFTSLENLLAKKSLDWKREKDLLDAALIRTYLAQQKT